MMEGSSRQTAVTSSCVAIVMSQCPAVDRHRVPQSNRRHRGKLENGHRIFVEFISTNRSTLSWNGSLMKSLNALEFVGFVRPGTLLVSAANGHLEQLRNAWVRRILKPPPGYSIAAFGNVDSIEMEEVPQTQFIPLSDVLSSIISTLNRLGQAATIRSITETLRHQYAGMTMPKEDMIYAAIGGLMAQGRLYSMGNHYFIASPYGQPNHPAFYVDNVSSWMANAKCPPTKSMKNSECQTGASIVGGPSCKPKASAMSEQRKTHTKPPGEKVGVWSRLFWKQKNKPVSVQRSEPIEDQLKIELAKNQVNLEKARKKETAPFCRNRNRHSMWIDNCAADAYRREFDPYAAGRQRLSTRFDEVALDTSLQEEEEEEEEYTDTVKPIRKGRRLNKCLSSSSECLQNLVMNQNGHRKLMLKQEYADLRYQSRHLNLHNLSARLNIETSPVKMDNCSKGDNLKTSTPGARQGDSLGEEDKWKRENRDSALSVSPIVTDASSSETKYSSWSGSEERKRRLETQQQHEHTYVNNMGMREILAGNNTYENLSFALEKLNPPKAHEAQRERQSSSEDLTHLLRQFELAEKKKLRVKASPAFISVL